MYIDLRQLRHVLALDQHRNFARAAAAIGLTQPALSRSIQGLEKSVGARLFDRDRSRVQPTQIGERLIARARPLLGQVSDIEHDVKQMLGLEVGLLRLGAGAYPADISVGRAVGRLLRRHPGLQVDFSVGDWTMLVKRVVSGELDLAIAEIALASGDERLHVEPLPQHPLIFYCRSGHPLARRRSLTLEDVRRYPLVATAVPPRLHELVKGRRARTSAAEADGAEAPEIRVDTVRLAWQIVMETDAIGGAVAQQIEDEVALGHLVPLPLELPWLRTNYGIIRLAHRTPGPAAETFIETLREVESEVPGPAPGRQARQR